MGISDADKGLRPGGGLVLLLNSILAARGLGLLVACCVGGLSTPKPTLGSDALRRARAAGKDSFCPLGIVGAGISIPSIVDPFPPVFSLSTFGDPLDPPVAEALPAIFLYFVNISWFIPTPPLDPALDGLVYAGSADLPVSPAHKFPALQLPFRFNCSKGPPRCGLLLPGPSRDGVGAPELIARLCHGDGMGPVDGPGLLKG